MGQEISRVDFLEGDFDEFLLRLREETKILKSWFDNDSFEPCPGEPRTFGAEMEAWLIDENHIPAPENHNFLHQLKDPMVVSELAQFNFELNCDLHRRYQGDTDPCIDVFSTQDL